MFRLTLLPPTISSTVPSPSCPLPIFFEQSTAPAIIAAFIYTIGSLPSLFCSIFLQHLPVPSTLFLVEAGWLVAPVCRPPNHTQQL